MASLRIWLTAKRAPTSSKSSRAKNPLPVMQPAKWQLGEVGLIGCDAVKARMRSEAVVRGRRDADGRRSPTLFRRGTGRNRGRCYILPADLSLHDVDVRAGSLGGEVMHASLHEKDARCSGT